MSTENRLTHKTEAVCILLVLAIIFALMYYTKATGLRFKSFTESDILAIITTMFVVAIFMERTIEAMLTPVRAPDRQKIEQELEDIRKSVGSNDDKKNAQTEKEHELERYNLNTTQRAYWISFVFGLVISLVGIRTLEGLVDPDALKALGDAHRAFFDFVDVVLTGGVIAGGSAAIDKIGRNISRALKFNSAADSKTTGQ